MESTIIQTSNQKDQGVPCQKEGGNQGRSPSSFYQQAPSQPTSPRREEEQEKELEKTIFPKLQDPQNPKRCHGQCIQHGQNFDEIQRQRGEKNETTPFPKDVVNTLTEIKNSLLSLQEMNNNLSSLTKIVGQNEKEIDNIKFIVENNKPKILIDNTQKLIQGQQELYKYIKDIKDKTLTINYDLSTPFSHIRSLVKPKEELTNPFITDLSHKCNNQVSMKDAPQLKEWPTFTGKREDDH
ncbi:hypothetical protein O181_106910, partial [Austropuccinia psidii MF-1]|nr:hypothetical protein [Austropuccinia psidii MF-1]